MNQEVLSVFVLWSIYLLFALGMNLVWGSIGILNFAHGGIFTFSAFLAHEVLAHVRLSIFVMVPMCVVIGAALSVAIQVLIFEPILKRAGSVAAAELQIIVAGIAVAWLLAAIMQKVIKGYPFGLSTGGAFTIQTYTFGGVRISNIQLLVIFTGLVVGIATASWMRVSKAGLALRAVGVDAETASMMGINRTRLAIGTMAIAGALAGLAGALLTYDLSAIGQETGDSLLIKAFAAIVLGGLGSVYGVAAGTFMLAFAETVVLTHTAGRWVDAISFGLIFLVLILRPQGIFGRTEVRRT